MKNNGRSLFGKISLFTILLGVPIFFLLFFSSGDQNFHSPDYYGPKSPVIKNGKETGDSTYFTIPDFEMTLLDGRIMKPSDFDGKIIIATITGKSCPQDCEVQPESISKILMKEFKENKNYRDVVILSELVSYDSEEKALAEDLNNYYNTPEIEKHWHFFTCDVNEFYDFVPYPNKENMYRANISGARNGKAYYNIGVLIDKKKHVRGIFNLKKSDGVRSLLDGVKLLKKEEDYAKN